MLLCNYKKKRYDLTWFTFQPYHYDRTCSQWFWNVFQCTVELNQPPIGSARRTASSWRQSFWLQRINGGALRHAALAGRSIATRDRHRALTSRENIEALHIRPYKEFISNLRGSLFYITLQQPPLTTMNGQMNGFHNSLIEEDCFLFTSESVGEGHPGKTKHTAVILTTRVKT